MRQTHAPTRARAERLDEQKRAALLSAAVAEIARHGFEAASLQRVAAAAGITRGLVYYYWSDRDDLLRAAVEHLRELLIAASLHWGAPADAAAFWASVRRVYERAFLELAARPHFLELFRRVVEAAQSPATHATIRELVGDAREALSRLLGAGQALGAVRADVPLPLLLDAAFALAGASDAWAIRQVAAGAAPADCIPATLTLLRSALEPPARRPRAR